MSRPRIALACVALMIVACGVTSAQESPKWSYVQAGYNDFDPEGFESDGGGFAGVSFSILRNFHLMAEYNDAGDFTYWNAGFGWHGLLGDPGDLFAEAVWRDVEVDTATNNVSDDGYGVDAGVRWRIGEHFEVKGQVNWADYDVAGSDTTFVAEGLVYFLGDRLGVGANVEFGDTDIWRVFGRFQWGR